jgi:diadenosine tetraphosphate (Ap4A) HIT family hydrolase
LLDVRLAESGWLVEDWTLSRLLLADDARFPWLILVPRRSGVSEIHQLGIADRRTLTEEIARASTGLQTISGVGKINVGALGNIVRQLHVHVVARHPEDSAWPGPVWGHGTPLRYELKARNALLDRLRREL